MEGLDFLFVTFGTRDIEIFGDATSTEFVWGGSCDMVPKL